MAEPKAPRPRTCIREMDPYRPPTSGRGGYLRLDFNENTIGPSPKAMERIRKTISGGFLSTYPEYETAREPLAEFFGVGPDQITFSDGTDEAIHVLLQTFVDPDDEVLIPWPTFPMYRFYAQTAAAKPVLVHRDPQTLNFPTDELIAAVSDKTRAILIANPNNPTGGAIGPGVVERILNGAPECVVLVDEAYFEFFGVTAIPLIEKYPNLFVSRTFSKTYGLAALRAGVLLSQEENIAWVRRGQSPYSLNSLGVAAMLAAIEDQDYVSAYVEDVLASRTRLEETLDRLSIPRWPSEANFVLANFGDDHQRIYESLKQRGILVRDRHHEVPGAVRLGVGTHAQTRQLIDALEEIVGGNGDV